MRQWRGRDRARIVAGAWEVEIVIAPFWRVSPEAVVVKPYYEQDGITIITGIAGSHTRPERLRCIATDPPHARGLLRHHKRARPEAGATSRTTPPFSRPCCVTFGSWRLILAWCGCLTRGGLSRC